MIERARPDVVYVTPLTPQPAGNGLAMRSAAILAALARQFNVHLCVMPVAGPAYAGDSFVRRHTVRSMVIDLPRTLDPLFALSSSVIDPHERAQRLLAYPKPFLSRFSTGEAARCLMDWCADIGPAALHVMRLYLAPMVEPFLRRRSHRPFLILDLDDDDTVSHQRLAALYEASGDGAMAQSTSAEANKFAAFATRYLPEFDRVAVSSNHDAHRLATACPTAHFVVIPNSIQAVPSLTRPRVHDAIRLLFVGTLGYFPNADAVLYLCREVLPALRSLTSQPIKLDIAGAGDSSLLQGISQLPDVTLHGYVDDLRPLYAAADVAVMPLRAGGGTRIKLLEAFACRVPVVATSLAAEGIAAEHQQHILLADDAQSFARSILNVVAQPERAAARVEQAARLVAAQHDPGNVQSAIETLYAAANFI